MRSVNLSLLLACIILGNIPVHGQEILHNAIVYTVDETNPWSDAIAIDDNGIIVAVGNFSDVVEEYPSYALTDLQGQLVLPGFQDAHLHVVEAGINGQLCYVESTPIDIIPYWFDEDNCTDGGSFGDSGWIVGAGVDLEVMIGELEKNSSAPYPIKVLDEFWPNTPVLILDQYGHGALANTVALQDVGYLNGPDPPGGVILRDPTDNSVIGIVLENAQQKLRDAAFPPDSRANQALAYDSLLKALQTLRENGITTVSDAGGFWRQAQTESWAQALEEGVLTVRASNALYVYPDENFADQLDRLGSMYSNDPDSLLRFNQAKLYVDGILELSTGLLYEPYLYDPLEYYRKDSQWSGFQYFGDNTTLNFYSEALTNLGFQLHFHVTGDAGAKVALEAIRAVQGPGSFTSGPYHRLTHCYLVNASDRSLFAELGVVADMQIAPSSMEDEYHEQMRVFLGPERAATLLPAMELYEAGATLTLSSDWDADTLSPLVKMQTVLTRRHGRSFPDLETVIPMLTRNPALLLGHVDKTGSIEAGKFADLVVIDKDIFSLPVEEISTAKVSRTYLQGKLIYGEGVADPTSQGSKEGDDVVEVAEEIDEVEESPEDTPDAGAGGSLEVASSANAGWTQLIHLACVVTTAYLSTNLCISPW